MTWNEYRYPLILWEVGGGGYFSEVNGCKEDCYVFIRKDSLYMDILRCRSIPYRASNGSKDPLRAH